MFENPPIAPTTEEAKAVAAQLYEAVATLGTPQDGQLIIDAYAKLLEHRGEQWRQRVAAQQGSPDCPKSNDEAINQANILAARRQEVSAFRHRSRDVQRLNAKKYGFASGHESGV
jgi:hypothetical protein